MQAPECARPISGAGFSLNLPWGQMEPPRSEMVCLNAAPLLTEWDLSLFPPSPFQLLAITESGLPFFDRGLNQIELTRDEVLELMGELKDIKNDLS